MTDTIPNSCSSRVKYSNPPMPERSRPSEYRGECQRIAAPTSVHWDPDIDRWTNEGGSIRAGLQLFR
jgi:hypothetical protein